MTADQTYHKRRALQERRAAAAASQCWHRDLHIELAELHERAVLHGYKRGEVHI